MNIRAALQPGVFAANKDVEILGPQRKYPPISAEDYLQQRIQPILPKGKMLP